MFLTSKYKSRIINRNILKNALVGYSNDIMPFRRSRSLYDKDRSRPVTPSAEGYLGPNELRDVSRSPIVNAGDDDDEEELV